MSIQAKNVSTNQLMFTSRTKNMSWFELIVSSVLEFMRPVVGSSRLSFSFVWILTFQLDWRWNWLISVVLMMICTGCVKPSRNRELDLISRPRMIPLWTPFASLQRTIHDLLTGRTQHVNRLVLQLLIPQLFGMWVPCTKTSTSLFHGILWVQLSWREFSESRDLVQLKSCFQLVVIDVRDMNRIESKEIEMKKSNNINRKQNIEASTKQHPPQYWNQDNIKWSDDRRE